MSKINQRYSDPTCVPRPAGCNLMLYTLEDGLVLYRLQHHAGHELTAAMHARLRVLRLALRVALDVAVYRVMQYTIVCEHDARWARNGAACCPGDG